MTASHELHQRAREPTDVTYEEVEVVGRRAIWANPIGAAQDRVILYFHGGGFIGGSIDCHRKMAAHIAKAAGCRTLLASYEMMACRAPEADKAIADVARWLRPKLGL